MTNSVKNLIIWLCAAAAVWFIYVYGFVNHTPLENLQRSGTEYARIVVPPDISAEISDKEELISVIKELKVTRRAIKPYFSGSSPVTLILRLTGGETVEIISCGNTYIVIDGRYYRTEDISGENFLKYADNFWIQRYGQQVFID